MGLGKGAEELKHECQLSIAAVIAFKLVFIGFIQKDGGSSDEGLFEGGLLGLFLLEEAKVNLFF